MPVIRLFDEQAFVMGQLDGCAAEGFDACPFTAPAEVRAWQAGWRYVKRPRVGVTAGEALAAARDRQWLREHRRGIHDRI